MGKKLFWLKTGELSDDCEGRPSKANSGVMGEGVCMVAVESLELLRTSWGVCGDWMGEEV